jgi:glycosyltransferase involved in cell wall biosynthesis
VNDRQVEISVVLPCLNEAETLAACIRKARASFAALGLAGEIVVADNGSSDASRDIALREGARVVQVPIRGYGAALRQGVAAARGRYVVMADADDSYALDELGPFLDQLRAGADLVMGNRFEGGIEPLAMPRLHRYFGTPFLSFLGRLFFGMPVGDFQCGMRAFRRDRFLDLDLRANGMEFASEMVVRFALRGLRIVEVPTTLRPDGRSRAPHLRTWRDGWRNLRLLLAFSPRWLFLYPALALLSLSGGALVWLAFGTQTIGGVSFDLHTMLAAATGVVLGAQATSLAVVSRAYAASLGVLPATSRLERLLDRVMLERGLLLGVTMVVTGVFLFAVALYRWGAVGFGELEVAHTMRLPIIGMVLVIAGFQAVLVSFMLSLARIGEN